MGPRWVICPKQKSFWKKIISFSFTYWPLSLCKIYKKFLQQIQSYEDGPFLGPKYLIGQQPFLAITWEPDFSQACSFCRMLTNFRFIQIPDKTNHMIFLKSPNSVFGTFLTIFGHSCPMRFFPKNLAVTHNYIWARNTMLSFRKN